MISEMRNTLLVVIASATLLLHSCEKDVILDLADMEGQFLVVEANITDSGDTQWIRLSRSTSFYNQSVGEPVEGATLTVNDGIRDYVFFETFQAGNEGFYLNPLITDELKPGRNYRLDIETANGRTYFAESTFLPVPPIDSVTIKLSPFSELGFLPEVVYDIVVHFRDLPGDGDHYLFNLYVNGQLKTPRPNDKAPLSDENLEEYVSLAVLNINRKDLFPGDTLTLEIRSISREKFDFYNIFFFQTDLSGNPFAGAPPANIPTNLSAGAKGFFQVSAIHRKSIIYDPQLP
ncbi:MAG: DUF4249 domain-containing protein [Bacteroidales bacterium]